MQASTLSPGSVNRDVYSAVSMCFLVALFEGLDIQSMGVAAPRVAGAFHLDPGQMGVVMSSSTLGLMIGAALGGWLSDRLGRKVVIVASMAALGVFSLATAFAPDFHLLIVARVLAGLGLGGAFPNLIALVSEITPRAHRVTALGLMYCGLPLGGASAGALMAAGSSSEWRSVFFVGGIGPIMLMPLLATCLPRAKSMGNSSGQVDTETDQQRFVDGLFGARTGSTLLLWTSYFFTLLAVYLLLNWLPSLLVAKGYSRTQGSTCAVLLNIGAAVGSIILGRLSDRGYPKSILAATYGGMIAALYALTIAKGDAIFLAAFFAGFFVIGGQLVLYAIAPTLYQDAFRGTGVGAAVAVGRIGSVAGPLLAGALLVHGFGPNTIPVAATPGLLIALTAILMLVSHQTKWSK
jgi:MFS transporter, AAHS family, 3-hydroxyphenylpropionic acid transporter